MLYFAVMTSENFPQPTRPCEYVALFTIEISTKEGPGFVFMAYDPYKDFVFNLSVEKNDNADSLLKNIYFLIEDPHFIPYSEKGFTLILEKYEELSLRILRILEPVSGKLIFDKAYNHYLSKPVLENFQNFLSRNKK